MPDGGERVCQDLTAPGAVTAPNDQAGTRSWTAFARPTAENSAPFVDLTLTFFANARSVTWTDNAELAGDVTSQTPGYYGFNAIIRAPATTSLLTVNTTFVEQPANFAWGQWVVGQPEPPLTQEAGLATKTVENDPARAGHVRAVPVRRAVDLRRLPGHLLGGVHLVAAGALAGRATCRSRPRW